VGGVGQQGNLGVGMKIAVGSDERTHVTDSVVDHLRRVGVEVELHGPLNDRPMD